MRPKDLRTNPSILHSMLHQPHSSSHCGLFTRRIATRPSLPERLPLLKALTRSSSPRLVFLAVTVDGATPPVRRSHSHSSIPHNGRFFVQKFIWADTKKIRNKGAVKSRIVGSAVLIIAQLSLVTYFPICLTHLFIFLVKMRNEKGLRSDTPSCVEESSSAKGF